MKHAKIVHNWVAFAPLLLIPLKLLTFLNDFVIPKLEACGSLNNTVKLIHNYLSNIKQTIKVNDAYISWKDIFYEVPQRSIFGPLLLNTHLFYVLEDYADDTTIYMVNEKRDWVISSLETFWYSLFGWYYIDSLKENSD